jgi:hypothetical protein
LFEKRAPIYALADFRVCSDSAPHSNTVDQIMKALASCSK